MNDYYLLALATFPGLLITAYIYWRDRHEPEPLYLLVICFIFGVLSTYPAIKLEEFAIYDLGLTINEDLGVTITFAFVVVAFSEELVKYIFLRYYIYPKDEFCEPMDGIVYAVTISMGFATLENILYVVVRAEDLEQAYQIAYARMFTAIPAHSVFAMTMGYFVGLAKFHQERESFLLLCGLGGAILLHGLYDFFIFQRLSSQLTIFTFVVLIGGFIIGKFMIYWHVKNSPHQNMDDTLDGGLPPPTDL